MASYSDVGADKQLLKDQLDAADVAVAAVAVMVGGQVVLEKDW